MTFSLDQPGEIGNALPNPPSKKGIRRDRFGQPGADEVSYPSHVFCLWNVVRITLTPSPDPCHHTKEAVSLDRLAWTLTERTRSFTQFIVWAGVGKLLPLDSRSQIKNIIGQPLVAVVRLASHAVDLFMQKLYLTFVCDIRVIIIRKCKFANG